MLTEARGKARSRLISAVLRNFAYWPARWSAAAQGVGHPHLLDDLAKTLRFLLQPTAQRGLAEKKHFRHPRHAPCLRRRQHNQLPHLRRQILLPLDEQRARIASLIQGQQLAPWSGAAAARRTIPPAPPAERFATQTPALSSPVRRARSGALAVVR